MDRQHPSRGFTQGDDGTRPGGRSVRTIRWINRAITGGLLTAATVMGVQLGMDAPTASPVSPPAIAEQAALLADGADVAQAMPVQRERGHHRRRGR